ncbi:MAG: hypothetical protein L0L69_06000 [Propionibacterium sp.]|nr:hypothetical protein [Propionibacterium sp.]
MPALVLVVPTVVHQLRESGGWAALMTPGGPALAVGSPPSWQVLLGIPSAVTWHPWVWVLGVPTGLLLVIGVLVASRSGRAAPTVRLGLGVCVLFLLVALALGHVDVAYTPGTAPTGSATSVAHAWISPALSVSAVALLVACLCACDSPLPWDDLRHRPVRVLAWFVGACSVAALGLWGVPGPLRAASWDHVAPAAGPGVPAVSVQAQLSPRAGRVLVLTHEGGVVHARVLRGPGTLATDASAGTRLAELTALRAGEQDAAREDLARAVVALVEYPDEDTVGALSRHGIDTVLLPDVVSDQGRRTANALDRAPGVEKVGTTAAGDLWRVRPQDSLPARLSVQAPDSVTVIRSGWVRTSVHIDQSISGTLVLAERADPGWRASVDGQPLTATEPDPGTWRQAFELPSGGHLVLDFRPWWLMPWRLASGVVLVGACLAALPLRRRR